MSHDCSQQQHRWSNGYCYFKEAKIAKSRAIMMLVSLSLFRAHTAVELEKPLAKVSRQFLSLVFCNRIRRLTLIPCYRCDLTAVLPIAIVHPGLDPDRELLITGPASVETDHPDALLACRLGATAPPVLHLPGLEARQQLVHVCAGHAKSPRRRPWMLHRMVVPLSFRMCLRGCARGSTR